MDIIRGEENEPFRRLLFRAFKASGISEDELAARLGPTTSKGTMSQPGAHAVLHRDGPNGPASLNEDVFRNAAAACGYDIRIELVPRPQGPMLAPPLPDGSPAPKATRARPAKRQTDAERNAGAGGKKKP